MIQKNLIAVFTAIVAAMTANFINGIPKIIYEAPVVKDKTITINFHKLGAAEKESYNIHDFWFEIKNRAINEIDYVMKISSKTGAELNNHFKYKNKFEQKIELNGLGRDSYVWEIKLKNKILTSFKKGKEIDYRLTNKDKHNTYKPTPYQWYHFFYIHYPITILLILCLIYMTIYFENIKKVSPSVRTVIRGFTQSTKDE